MLVVLLGTGIGLLPTVLLSIEGTTVWRPASGCPGMSCPPVDPTFVPYLPLWLALPLALAATLPLICLVRPGRWQLGAFGVTLTEGAFGAFLLLFWGFASLGTEPFHLTGFALWTPLWLVGSIVAGCGFWMLRPREEGRTTYPPSGTSAG